MGKEIRLKAQWSLYQGWGSKPVFSRPNDALPVASGSRTLSRYFSNMIEMPEDRSLLLALGQTVGINLRPLIRMHSGRYGNFEALVAQQQAELEGEESPGHNWENKEVQAQLKRIKKKYARQEKTILRWEAEAYMETSSFILLIQNWLESIQHNPEFYRMLDLSQFSLNEAEKKVYQAYFRDGVYFSSPEKISLSLDLRHLLTESHSYQQQRAPFLIFSFSEPLNP